MGFDACVMAVKYVQRYGGKCVVDPFCGKGSVLAVANHFGLDSVGGTTFKTKRSELIIMQLNFQHNEVETLEIC